MSSTKRGGQRSPSDNYPTPSWCVHRFLEVFLKRYPVALQHRRWLEPGAGEGNIIRSVNSWFDKDGPTWHATELREECEPFLQKLGVEQIRIGDYFTGGPPQNDLPYDMIITNPPFSLAMEFIHRSMEANTRFVAMLLRLNYIGSQKRFSFMSKFPPELYVIPNRPSFKGTGETDSIEYAWFVWDKENLGTPGTYTLLDLTSKEERYEEHERLKELGIFPELEEVAATLKPMPADPNEPEQGWECYECKSTSGFIPHVDWESGVQDDVECGGCGSSNTGPQGEG